jgi:heat shock protein HslJ/uncharacterized membrane protein
MKNILIIFLVLFGLIACSQQQRVTNHTPPMDYGEKGPHRYSDQLMNKLEKGIDFIASGHEPEWSLEVDFDSVMLFKSILGDSVQIPAPKGTRLQDSAASSYTTKIGSKDLTVTIYDQPCVDNLTGKELPKTVEISYGEKKYKGCGSYLSDYRLNDIWVLESINDEQIKITSFPKGLPRLELNLTLNQVFTFAGCNEFSASLEVQGKKLRFGRFSGTLMACPNINFESKYLNHLANKTVPFRIEPGKLFLQVSDDTVYLYRKVD